MPPRTRTTFPDERQTILPLSPVRNSNFLSNHWLEHRLPLEPEWTEQSEVAQGALDSLLSLWREERDRVALYGDEAGLEEKFIQPVFEILGWYFKYQPHLNGREPDYALFLDNDDLNAALDQGRLNPDFWKPSVAVADAKAWHVSLDKPAGSGSTREYPPEQIEWYINHSLKQCGILTNGRQWRLVPRLLGPAKPRFQTFLEVDLPALLESLIPPGGSLGLGPSGAEFDDFLRFYLLFSPVGFASTYERKPLIQRAIDGSSEYSIGVGEELKDRVFEALRLCVEGFISRPDNALHHEKDLRACQEHGLIFLYRLLFIMYAEDRGLLPYRINRTYTNNRSLARHRDEIATRLDQVSSGLRTQDYSQTDVALWHDLKDLFDLIDRGHKRYGVHAYNGGLFDLEADEFLTQYKLTDWYTARILDQLGRVPQPGQPDLGLFRVDYRDLAIQQLGNVYEGLLESHPRYALQDMRVIRARSTGSKRELIQPVSKPVPNGFESTSRIYESGSIFLATEKGERRRTGSYYTPDHIVDYIVQKTLGAQCQAIFDQLQDEIASREGDLKLASSDERTSLEREILELQGNFDDRVLKLKILDPAMGSGHFLIRACQYLAEEIATNPYTSDPNAEDLEGDESTITFWKRRIAENCLHGVDVNPMAVELAKLALWLETTAADAPLTFLDHHLHCGDSLIGARIDRLNSLPSDEGLLEGQFTREVETALPRLLKNLEKIGDIPSDTAEQVKKKEEIYKQRFLPTLDRFSEIANLWTAEALEGDLIRPDQYAEALETLGKPRRFSEVRESNWAQTAYGLLAEKDVLPFNWELAYPHVFLANIEGGQVKGGFDIILGNPPYEVLSEKETGKNIDHVRRFIDLDSQLAPARIGKNNLYKLFIARSVNLLADGGYLSFIVPMALLGDGQARGIRHMLLSNGQFSDIHAFPQKDNVARRVFPDAKLATALFVYRRLPQKEREDGRFASYVHTDQFIDESSAGLWTDSNSIKVYDPENLTIVSCTQEDWDLMASLRNKRIARLRDYVRFYQGEV
ncbi:MAG: Eco57I restriction-modification methylase domain-containing protein, partial [Candidatus Poribacteria bacterium]|nr:Eco57I restriction-modification methylase domain-containing protein [Candidatus Poribacteria bacterium]